MLAGRTVDLLQDEKNQLDLLTGTSLCLTSLGRTLVLVHRPCAIDTNEWQAHIDALLAQRPSGVVVVVPPGCPGPSADQRRRLGSALAGLGDLPIGVLTRSALHRHLITAINWITGGGTRAFAPSHLADAMEYAAVPVEQRATVAAKIAQLAHQMGIATDFPEVA